MADTGSHGSRQVPKGSHGSPRDSSGDDKWTKVVTSPLPFQGCPTLKGGKESELVASSLPSWFVHLTVVGFSLAHASVTAHWRLGRPELVAVAAQSLPSWVTQCSARG